MYKRQVLDSAWYTAHSDTGASIEDQRAATLAAAHASTPTTTHFDVLGRAFLVQQHNGFDTATPPNAILYETRTALDITGNPLSITDARGNTPLEHVYDLLARPLETVSAEAGASRMLPDLAGTPVRTWNSRNVVMRTTFDAVRRPTHVYCKIGSATETLVLRTIYGEELGSSASLAANLRARAYRAYDSAGAQTNVSFDFKGNPLQTERRLTTAYTTTPDWSSIASLTSISAIETTAAPLLETEVFTTSSTYDALNRVVTATTPDASITAPTYNEANQLVAESVKIRGATTPTSFVSAIHYNARGQRTKITYANNTVTEYTYDSKTLRLTRLLTTRTTDSAVLQDLRYTYDPVGNIVQTKDIAQQTVYFSNTVVSPDSKYEYDALYRLTRAEGREHPAHAMAQPDEVDSPLAALPHPNDLQALKRYVEEYAYDGVGNILSMTHREVAGGTINWKRLYQYATASNKLRATSDPADTPATPPVFYTDSPTYTDLYPHDTRGHMTAMPHLAAMDWDYGDRLQHCDLTGGGDAYFTYDGAGNRLRKVWVNNTGSIVDERIYVGGCELWRHRVSGTLDEERQTLHVMDDQRRVAMVETKTVAGGSTVSSPTPYLRYQLDDHLGTSRVECDGSGALLTYEEYHPYGTTAFRASSGATGFAPKRYRYTGKERDDETGLYYYGARYYPPWLGRWTACDSSGADGLNRYTYVRCNPVTFNDPTGREAEKPWYENPWVKLANRVAPMGPLAIAARAHKTVDVVVETVAPEPEKGATVVYAKPPIGTDALASGPTGTGVIPAGKEAYDKGKEAIAAAKKGDVTGAVGKTLDATDALGTVGVILFGVYSGVKGGGGAPAEAPKPAAEPAPAKLDAKPAAKLPSGEPPPKVASANPKAVTPKAGTAKPPSGEPIDAGSPTRGASAPPPPPSGSGSGVTKDVVYHYTTREHAANIKEKGLYSQSSATDVGTYTPTEAVELLGVKTPPEVVVVIENGGQFRPNKPATVQPHPLGPGGGTDLTNSKKVPPASILEVRPIRETF